MPGGGAKHSSCRAPRTLVEKKVRASNEAGPDEAGPDKGMTTVSSGLLELSQKASRRQGERARENGGGSPTIRWWMHEPNC